MTLSSRRPTTDRFGNPIDPSVGYARGAILRSSLDEMRRLQQARRVTAHVLAERGPQALSVFTGNQRAFPIQHDDLTLYCDEWFGPGLIHDRLRAAVMAHLHGGPEHDFAVFNRASAALHEHDTLGAFRAALHAHAPRLVFITSVTSNLDRIDEPTLAAMVDSARQAGAAVCVDDAYGARLRTVLHGGAPALLLGADLVITNADKAGLIGPRAGLLAGDAARVADVAACGAELGMEARGPILVGVMRSLEAFDPDSLRARQAMGAALTHAMRARYGHQQVASSDLGPVVNENDVLQVVLQRAGLPSQRAPIVPAEATSALCMLLLREHGILTTNTHGQPGAKVSLRLRPPADALARFGDMAGVVDAVDDAMDVLAKRLADEAWVRGVVVG